jgi:hypothetical protein
MSYPRLISNQNFRGPRVGIKIVVTMSDNIHSKRSKLENKSWVMLPNHDKVV